MEVEPGDCGVLTDSMACSNSGGEADALLRLRFIAEGTAAATGEAFFASLTRNLARALEVRYCFVSECTEPSALKVRMLSFWQEGEYGPLTEYSVAGHPCEKVLTGEVCRYSEGVQALYPQDRGLAALGVESYLGVPLKDARGSTVGHLVVMDSRQRPFVDDEVSIIKIFATRACAELERQKTEAALRNSQRRLQALLEINNAVVSKLSRDELFQAIGNALCRVVPFDRLALSLFDEAAGVLRIATYAGSYQRPDYSPIGRVLKLDDSPAGQAFARREAVVRPDLGSERKTASEERAYGHGFRSMCALPLLVYGRGIGAITLGSLTPFQYAQADADFLMSLAGQIALAVDNMTAHEETEELKARFQAEAVYLQEEIKTEHNFDEIIGQSAPLREVLRKIEQVAPTDATILINGETGTGKELLARAVHSRSKRNSRPLVKVNCGSIPSGLVESELFGHEKGAFTGATQRRIGRFELANGGTIFLDEVSELPVDTQVKLLRVLQEGEFERVGSSQTIKVDARVIAATNRDLKEAVRSGVFRPDLFYRLNVFPLHVPPLRHRTEDIALLVSFFLSRFGAKLGKELRGVSQRSMQCLMQYQWPGNIRELQNVIERAAVLAKGPVVEVDIVPSRDDDAVEPAPAIDTLQNIERNHILRALSETRWVIHGRKGAAEILGINPSTLRSRMEKLGIRRQT
ncbi:MAG TPA: sigma 54-interacting transcriptional regulator [Candidatus Binatia bacterium]|nr:sigma 54-interacting transcriptional regulator [Candidatus Binatia bacterium]